MHPRGRGLAAVLVAVLVVVAPSLTGIPAAAGSTDDTGGDTTSCVLEGRSPQDAPPAVPDGEDPAPAEDPERSPAEPGTLTCFPDLAEAMRYVTDGAIDLPPGATILEESQLDALAGTRATGWATSRTVMGIEYQDSNFRGPSLVLTWPEGGADCYGGDSYGFPSMGAYRWGDRISSAKAIAPGCWSTHYEHAKYRGDRITCSRSCTSMGAMNDKTSSIVFW